MFSLRQFGLAGGEHGSESARPEITTPSTEILGRSSLPMTSPAFNERRCWFLVLGSGTQRLCLDALTCSTRRACSWIMPLGR
eukprot:1313658-Pyramimonas_sp.AAC.1